MAARARPIPNLIADAFVERLRVISAVKDEATWFTSPHVERSLMVSDWTSGETPLLRVRVMEWAGEQNGTYDDARLTVGVYCITKDGGDGAEDSLLELVSDVIRAIHTKADLGLGNVVINTRATTYQPETEAMQQSGRGVARVDFEVFYTWATTAP